MRRTVLALGLALLSPLVAEFLLGDFPLTSLPFLALLAPTYGGAALLIREVARRAGLGWPSIVLMSLAYGVFEEGIMTMSLFNPDYAGAHLLAKGFVPALGIAVPWTLFVLGLHTVWSMSVPIALVEELAGPQRTTPWLGGAGLAVTAVLAGLGAAAMTFFSYMNGHFLASVPQIASVLVIVAALVALAFRLPERRAASVRRAPSPWLVLGVTLAAGVVFEFQIMLPGPLVGVAIAMLVLAEAGMAVLALFWSGGSGWRGAHRVALAGGALLTYVWHLFFTPPLVPSTPAMVLASHLVFGLGAVALLAVTARRAQIR
ncbi:hypothetical protein ABT294_32895 [Nonomuraea sp. NPDC000554]|uniref:hypothetical protein n=1 Tax=Nonomuraea sp. NPDC000554 TaxID=3154259 RepID=UPI00332F1C05